MKKMKKMNDRGFSLVELMVVIGIIAVVLGAFTYGYSIISNKQVDQCAKKLQSTLDSTRNTAMGKSSVDLKISYESGKIIAVRVINGDTANAKRIELGDGDLSVTYYFNNGSSKTLAAEAIDKISFDRASGSLKAYTGSLYINKISISNGRKNIDINIDKLTGRVTMVK